MATHAENTIPGFLQAISCGADGAELDIAVTADSKLVVTHDLIVRSEIGVGQVVHRHTAGQLGLPLLQDVLSLHSPETFWFDIEAKSEPGLTPDPEHYSELLSAAIRKSVIAHRIMVRSFDHQFLRAFQQLQPRIPLSALIDYASDDWPLIASSAAASAISPHYSTITSERVDRAHRAGVRVSAWTVNEPMDWDRLAAMRVDTIITDDPAAAVRHFRERFS